MQSCEALSEEWFVVMSPLDVVRLRSNFIRIPVDDNAVRDLHAPA